jgi:hypothetical protein
LGVGASAEQSGGKCCSDAKGLLHGGLRRRARGEGSVSG